MKKNVFIYSLSDPITEQIRYIGKTNNIKKRYNKHINESKKNTKSHKKAWINSLINKSLFPTIQVIDIVLEKEWKFWEIYWINQMKSWGFKLTNEMNGGEGVNVGNIPWNKGIKGSIKANRTSFKKGSMIGEKTRIKKGQRLSIKTEFKKGGIPWNRKKIQQFDLNGNFIKTWNSIIDAANSIGVTYGAISNCLKRKTNKCKGFIWKIK